MLDTHLSLFSLSVRCRCNFPGKLADSTFILHLWSFSAALPAKVLTKGVQVHCVLSFYVLCPFLLLCAHLYSLFFFISVSSVPHSIEWQRPLSGVHSKMMEKLAQAGGSVGCTPTPFHYHPLKSCGVRSSWEDFPGTEKHRWVTLIGQNHPRNF